MKDKGFDRQIAIATAQRDSTHSQSYSLDSGLFSGVRKPVAAKEEKKVSPEIGFARGKSLHELLVA